ncbi:Rha family transcriptional regulator [Shewanella algae]|uniref:Rha family transcriptional regulator n=1 Tax=Shewanella algae TaxID=38313 RepID=UPI0034D4FC0E
MSSREIAELTGKTHFNVCADIRNMLEQLNVEQKPFLDFDNSGANGRTVAFFRLPRRECEILVTGYDVVRRAAVIDRWLELETKQRRLPNMTPGPLRFTVDQGMIG